MKVYLALLILPALTACTASPSGMAVNLGIGSSIGRHVGLGTSVSIPVQLPSRTSSDRINTSEEQIVTYFDAQGRTSDSAVKGGYYRQLISKRGNNEYIVQDFYESNSKKRTDPIILKRNQLMDFNAYPQDGTLTIYAHNGNIMRQQTYQNGKLTKADY